MLQTLTRITIILGLACSLSLQAAPQVVKEVVVKKKENKCSPTGLYTGIYGGYTALQGMLDSDGRGAQGRFAIGFETPSYYSLTVGAEVGIQSGNLARVDADSTVINKAGRLPIQVLLKPSVDLLATAKFPLLESQPLSLLVKGGVAYQQLQLVGRSSNQKNIDKFNPELHVGFSYQVNNFARIVAFYQGIYSGKSAETSVDSSNSVNFRRIPTQHGGFMGIEFTL